MKSLFLKIENNKAFFTEELLLEINKKSIINIEDFKIRQEIQDLKHSIEIFKNEIRTAKLMYLI